MFRHRPLVSCSFIPLLRLKEFQIPVHANGVSHNNIIMTHQSPPSSYFQLIAAFKEYRLLESVGSIVGWDQHTYMPTKGAGHRAEQMGYLAKLGHEKLTSPRLGELLGQLEGTGD